MGTRWTLVAISGLVIKVSAEAASWQDFLKSCGFQARSAAARARLVEAPTTLDQFLVRSPLDYSKATEPAVNPLNAYSTPEIGLQTPHFKKMKAMSEEREAELLFAIRDGRAKLLTPVYSYSVEQVAKDLSGIVMGAWYNHSF